MRRVEDSNYTDQEAIEALDFLHKMNSEYYKNVIKKGDTTAFHNTDRLRLDCYSRENARNRDIMSIERHNIDTMEIDIMDHHFTEMDEIFQSQVHLYSNEMVKNYEDVIIELLDWKYLAKSQEGIEN